MSFQKEKSERIFGTDEKTVRSGRQHCTLMSLSTCFSLWLGKEKLYFQSDIV